MSFRLASIDGRAVLVDGDHYHDLESTSGGRLGSDPMAAIAAFADLHEIAGALSGTPTGAVADATFDCPVPRPTNCVAIGLNYSDHVAEASMEMPENPLVFTKFPSCIAPGDADIDLRSTTADWEVELVVVIGTGGRDIDAADAWSHVAGVAVGQDISDRALQFAAKPPHFDLGKSRDTYGPIGPWIVSVDALPNKDDLAISCAVNGETKQQSRTSQLIFDVPTLIEYVSGVFTLQVGDVIFTGTPDGVGATTGTFLQPGDVITSTIEGIGTITNRCV